MNEFRAGNGSAMAHHGELLQGVFEDPRGDHVPAVLSLPQPSLRSRATFVPGGVGVTVIPSWRTKARRAAELTLAALCGQERLMGGVLRIRSALSVSRGQGSSTADVVAAIRATAAACGAGVATLTVARLAVAAEGASDGVMFGSRAVLYANRVGHGSVLTDFGGPLPPLAVLGFDAGGTPVNTLTLRAFDYGGRDLEIFRWLRRLARAAVRTRNAAWIGQVATASARVNQRFLPCGLLDEVHALTRGLGAVGVQVAHTGRLVGVLYEPVHPRLQWQLETTRERLATLGITTTWGFRPWTAEYPAVAA